MQLFSKVLLVHRSNLLCEMLRESLEHRNYSVLTYSTSGQEALNKSFDYHPDLLIVGNALPGLSGVEMVEKLKTNGFEGKYLFLSQDAGEVNTVYDSMNVDGHIHTFDGMSELFFAIHEIASGRQYISESILKQMEQISKEKPCTSADSSFLKKLTRREIQIMKALSNSLTTPQIANNFSISRATVNNHRANISRKLKIKGRNKLMAMAISLKPFY